MQLKPRWAPGFAKGRGFGCLNNEYTSPVQLPDCLLVPLFNRDEPHGNGNGNGVHSVVRV